MQSRTDRSRRLRRWAAVLPVVGVSLLAAAVGWGREARANPNPLDVRPNAAILTWNTIVHDAFVAHDKYGDPLNAVRVLTILHIAQHDAINAVAPVYRTYALQARDAQADPEAAAAAAAHGVLASIFPAQREALDATLAQALAGIPDGEAETRGVTLGQQAAAAVLERRKDDGSNTPVVGDYVPGAGSSLPPSPSSPAPTG